MWHTISFIVTVDQKSFSIARHFPINLRTMNSGMSVEDNTQLPLSLAGQ